MSLKRGQVEIVGRIDENITSALSNQVAFPPSLEYVSRLYVAMNSKSVKDYIEQVTAVFSQLDTEEASKIFPKETETGISLGQYSIVKNGTLETKSNLTMPNADSEVVALLISTIPQVINVLHTSNTILFPDRALAEMMLKLNQGRIMDVFPRPSQGAISSLVDHAIFPQTWFEEKHLQHVQQESLGVHILDNVQLYVYSTSFDKTGESIFTRPRPSQRLQSIALDEYPPEQESQSWIYVASVYETPAMISEIRSVCMRAIGGKGKVYLFVPPSQVSVIAEDTGIKLSEIEPGINPKMNTIMTENFLMDRLESGEHDVVLKGHITAIKPYLFNLR